jgi:hypothetical protein
MVAAAAVPVVGMLLAARAFVTPSRDGKVPGGEKKGQSSDCPFYILSHFLRLQAVEKSIFL